MNPFYKKIVIYNAIILSLIVIAVGITTRDVPREGITMPIVDSIYDGVESTTTPLSITIPAINIVDARIVPVGKTAQGNMAVPLQYDDVGWYRYGPAPGQIGNSVIAGHLDDGKGNGAVFYRLSELTIGDRIYIMNAEGEKLAFAVREIRLIDYNDPPLQEIFGETKDGMHMNIITCDGIWIPEKKMYDKRLVVFTDRVDLVENDNL